MKSIVIPLLWSLSIATASSQQIWHVNHAAVGYNNGTSWEDAFINLQSAISVALYGDQIWVATGTYLPTGGTNREISFNIPQGVELYGGFAGNEATLVQRNFTLNPTILSGDIGLVGDRTDNSYHVVTIFRGDEHTVLDGFTITLGYGAEAFTGFPHEYGGGVLVVADAWWPLATPMIANCRFENNRAGTGGGLACVGDYYAICSPTIRDCLFSRNKGGYYGGGFYKSGRNQSERAFCLYNCKFEDNRALIGGGAFLQDATDTVRIVKCAFTRDTAIEAGGIRLLSGFEDVRYEIDSCVFMSNFVMSSSSAAIGHLCDYPSVPIERQEILVKKCDFMFNRSGDGAAVSSTVLGNVRLHRIEVSESLFSHNVTQNGGAGIYLNAGSLVNSEISVDRCFFFDNKTLAASVAGAFYYRKTGGGISKNRNTISNSVFMYNDGAIASLGGNPGITHTTVANCSFFRNGKIPFVKYWGVNNNPDDFAMTMQVLNSVVWEPQTEGVHRLFYNNDPSNFTLNDYRVEHSMIHLSDCEYNGENPCGDGMIYEQWPNFIDTVGQLGLVTWDFAGRNRGNNTVVDTLGLNNDYTGLARIFCDTVDIGAYEFHNLCPPVSATNEMITLSVGIRILQNPIYAGTTIRAEIFATSPTKFLAEFIDLNGCKIWNGTPMIQSFMPTLLHIPSERLVPGLYLLRLLDENGRLWVEKVVIL